jgi:CubicO group peptidase (beta-lactamase class C family)
VASAPLVSAGLDPAGLHRLHDTLAAHTDSGQVPGLVALLARREDIHVEVLGHAALDDPAPLRRDAIFRIASMTKPIAAAGAMLLADDGVLSLNDPVDALLPELAGRRVLRTLKSSLDDTVPAERSITVEDLLTFRLGFGSIMGPPGRYPIQAAEAELGLMTLGPAWPPPPFDSDEWIARFGSLPLLDQPGAAWRYNTGAQVLGVLLERASGQPLEDFLRERLFGPLGMVDTSFSVPAEKQARFTTAYMPDEDGSVRVLDPPAGGWWNQPQAMANAAGMLVSTLDDYWAFVSMVVAKGRHEGQALLSPGAVEAMTTDHLTADQRASSSLFLGAHGGWGYGMATAGPTRAGPPEPSGYGWNGGLGTLWTTDPDEGLTGIVLSTRAMTSPEPQAHAVDFWAAAYAARVR